VDLILVVEIVVETISAISATSLDKHQ